MEHKPEDQPGGFETSSELRHEYEEAERSVEERAYREPRVSSRRALGVWRAWAVVLIMVVVGLVIYFLVTSF